MSNEATLQDKKASGGKIALEGFDFQRNYALIKLVESIPNSRILSYLDRRGRGCGDTL